MKAIQTVFVVLLGLWCVGCEPEFYRAETRLLADGSIERAVYQPLDRTPEDVRENPAWAETHTVRKAKSETERQMPIRDLSRWLEMPAGRPAEMPLYWIAMGKSTTAATIPNHLVFKAPEGLPEGRLVPQLERRDWGVVTEWTWTETLTDSVALADHRVARTEVIDATVKIVVAACAETWGPDYDLKDFEGWLRGEVATCFQEVCDTCLALGLNKHKRAESEEANLIPFAEIAKRHGLDLFDDQHKLLKDDQESRKRIENFWSEKLRLHVRDKQGRPLSDEHVKEVLRSIHQSDTVQGETAWSQSLTRAAYDQHGGKEKFEELANRLGTRLFGLYCWPVLHNSQSFDYQMDVTGIVLETNATLVAEGKLRWKFEASDAFPLGYVMRAVVAIPNAAALAKHFPDAKFDTREAVVEYLDALRADADLRIALNDLVQKNDPTAWDSWRETNPDPKRPVRRLIERLKPKP